MSEIRLRKATLSDLKDIENIYKRARVFMANNGNPHQWGDRFPLTSSVIEDIRLNRFNLLVDTDPDFGEERILAQFALCEGTDEVYAKIDGAWLDDVLPYVTIHRLASSGVKPKMARECLKWAKSNYSNVRIDTHPDNLIMQKVILREGFSKCGLVVIPNRAHSATRIAYQWLRSHNHVIRYQKYQQY